MPPKTKRGRREIIEAALDEVRESGFLKLNVRAVARRLECSTMPIFSVFSGMEELKKAVVDEMVALYESYIEKGLLEEKPFKGAGRAYIRFAKEEPKFFEALFMSEKGSIKELPTIDPTLGRVIAVAEGSSGLQGKRAEKIHQEMWIFVHGVSTMYATNSFVWKESAVDEMLTDVFLGLKERLSGGKV